jgi:hypothetical protein
VSSTQALLDEIYAAIASGQYRLASLAAAEALECAHKIGDTNTVIEASYWAAEAAQKLGNYPKALQHIIDGEHLDSSISLSRWRRRVVQFDILSCWQPYREDLKLRINEMKRLGSQFAAPKADVCLVEAILHALVGDWTSALREASQGYRDALKSPEGVVAYAFAKLCATACIRLREFSAAKNWIALVGVRENIKDGWEPQIIANQAILSLTLARARGLEIAKLRALLEAVEDTCRKLDEERYVVSMHTSRFRVELLDPSNGDPETLWHPARAACFYRFKDRLNVHQRYVHNLQVLDLRLASLRFACGLTPLDDDFASPPLGALSCTAHPDLARRLRRAHAALAVAYRHARRIDTMLECVWREEEVKRRAAWIEAIDSAVSTVEPIKSTSTSVNTAPKSSGMKRTALADERPQRRRAAPPAARSARRRFSP